MRNHFVPAHTVQVDACRVLPQGSNLPGTIWLARPRASNAVRIKALSTKFPGAYKDIDQVMDNQIDLVETVHTLKQVLCVKG